LQKKTKTKGINFKTKTIFVRNIFNIKLKGNDDGTTMFGSARLRARALKPSQKFRNGKIIPSKFLLCDKSPPAG
jgi:hypothetical protein